MAQVYKAGDMFSNYVDINPDTTLSFYSQFFSETYYFDVNNDVQNDFLIKSYSSGGLGGSTNYINIFPLDLNGFIRFGRKDSVYNSYMGFWQTGQFAMPLIFGDIINELTADWRNQNLSLINRSGQTGTYLSTQDWVSINDLYIGLRYQTSLDTIYGWIRVNCPYANTCVIKDYSSTVSVNSVSEIKSINTFLIYPNPTTSILTISSSNATGTNSEIEVVSTLGQTVLMQSYSKSVDVSMLSKGLYTLKVITQNKEIYYSKFIKE